MDRAAHAVRLLVRQYGIVLRRMAALLRDEQSPVAVWRGLQALEPRVLFSVTPIAVDELPGGDAADGDADLVVEWDRQADEAETASENATDDLAAVEERRELVIVDAAAPDAEQLLADLLADRDDGRALEVVMLDGERDGIEQIGAILAGRTDLDAVHVIAHGNEQGLRLGDSWLDGAALETSAGEIAAWGEALGADADILLYGCNLAASADGRAVIDGLATLTGADVAASDDLTGAAAFGGDWTLEYAAGTIESQIAFSQALQQTYQGVFVDATFQEGTDGYSGTSDTSIKSGQPATTFGANSTVVIDAQGATDQGLLRFDNLFGAGPGKVPWGATILNVSLTIEVTEASQAAGSQVLFHRMLTGWDDSSTWNSLGGGVQTDDVEALATPDASIAAPGTTGQQVLTDPGLADSVQAWADGDANHGWLLINTHNNDWGFRSSEHPTVATRPILTVTYNTAPVITAGQAFNVAENSANGTVVGTPAATDAEAQALQSWTIVSGNDDGIFAINASTGQITVADNTLLDRETTASHDLEISVADPYATSATETVTITIDDVNDIAPTVTPAQSFDVDENVANGTSVGTVVATDPDTVGTVGNWTIVSGNDDGIFAIDATTGEITITDNTLLDYENDQQHVLTVTAGDGVNTSAQETVTIDVNDVNDVAPTVTPAQGFDIDENVANGTSVGTVLATDPDTVGTIGNWTIVAGNDDGIFAIDAVTGEVTIADNTLLDYENAQQHVLTVTAGDGVNTSAQETVTVDVNDLNDVAPTVTPAQSFDVDENVANGTAVGTVVATDPDTVGTVGNWTIVSGNDDGIFAIDAVTGEITIADNTLLDYENAQQHVLTVTADDGANTSAQETVTIDVNDLNDVTPTVTPAQAFDVDENVANGTSVGTVVATDPDTVGTVGNWTIVAGNDDGIFAIDANTGEITIADNTLLDYENDQQHVLTVTAGDGVSTSAQETVTIDVNDLNDVAPTVTAAQGFDIDENVANGTSVGTVLATDPDTVGTIGNWTIVAGNDDGIFAIDANTGEITIADNTLLDYENTQQHVLTVTAGDGVNTSAQETVTIDVNDLNDVAPTVTPAQGFDVDENVANGTAVGTVVATDPDTVGTVGNWTIVSGNDDGIFAIDAVTGEVTIADNTLLDYENAQQYVLTVTAGDGVNTSAQETVTIDVNDLNDVTPTVTPAQSFDIDENVADGTSVGTVLATDPDTVGTVGNWTIVAGNDDGIFAIDANTGEVTIADNTLLDYENAQQHVLTVTAGDGVNTSAQETVTIDVNDLNDVAPTVTPAQSFDIDENVANGTSVGTVLATDPDTVGTVGNWTIVAGNDDGIFAIDAVTGEVTIADNTLLDHENAQQHVLTVTAGDGANTSAQETVTIDVNNVAELPTTSGLADITLDEDPGAPIVLDLHAAFADPETADADLLFNVVANSNGALFGSVTVDLAAGTLTLDPAADANGVSDLTVRATDGDGMTVDAAFRVTLDAVNDAPTMAAQQTVQGEQGVTTDIDATVLRAADVDDAAVDIVFTVDDAPDRGTLVVDGVSLAAGDTFTQADIDAGRLAYVHGGGGGAADAFAVSVTDAGGATITATIDIAVEQTTSLVPPPDDGDELDGLEWEQPELPGGPDLPDIDDDLPPVEDMDVTIYPVLREDTGPLRRPSDLGQSIDLGSTELVHLDDGDDRSDGPTRDDGVMPVAVEPEQALSLADIEFDPGAVLARLADITEGLQKAVTDQAIPNAIALGSAASLVGALSVGYTIWAIRGGSLMASILSSMPVWRMIDPLPVLEGPRTGGRRDHDVEDEAERRVGRMLG